MPLAFVQYSDSESDDAGPEPSSTNALKRKHSETGQASPKLPPLPAAFHDLYSTNARASTSDDPSLHRGRRRAVPHVEGNWPSHVYLEWLPSQADIENLNSLIDHVRNVIQDAIPCQKKALPIPEIHPLLLSELGTPVPLHVSLSRTLQIKTDDREHFLETLTSSIRRAAVRPFNVRFTGLKLVPNHERNRWFLVLGIEKPSHDELNRLLDACNSATERCGHPPLYIEEQGDGPMEDNTSSTTAGKKQKRSMSIPQKHTAEKIGNTTDRTENFHVSIAWNLIQPHPEWVTLAKSIDVSKFIASPQTPFEAVKAKVGNIINNIELDPRKASLGKKGGLLGLG